MIRTIATLLTVLFALGLGPTPALAACTLKLKNINNFSWTGGGGGLYDVFDPVQYTQTEIFKLTKKGKACDYFITFSPGNAGNYNRLLTAIGSLSYQIYDTPTMTNVLKDLPEATVNEVISGNFKKKDKKVNISYVVSIPPQQVKPPGIYSDRFDISAYEGQFGNGNLQKTKSVTFSATVVAQADLSLVGGDFVSGADHPGILFGDMTAGLTRSTTFEVRTNSGYIVTFESFNGSILDLAGPDPSVVPYTTRVDGTFYNLPAGVPTTVATYSGLTGVNGRSHAIDFTIGNYGTASAGTYTDNIIVSVSTN